MALGTLPLSSVTKSLRGLGVLWLISSIQGVYELFLLFSSPCTLPFMSYYFYLLFLFILIPLLNFLSIPQTFIEHLLQGLEDTDVKDSLLLSGSSKTSVGD